MPLLPHGRGQVYWCMHGRACLHGRSVPATLRFLPPSAHPWQSLAHVPSVSGCAGLGAAATHLFPSPSNITAHSIRHIDMMHVAWRSMACTCEPVTLVVAKALVAQTHTGATVAPATAMHGSLRRQGSQTCDAVQLKVDLAETHGELMSSKRALARSIERENKLAEKVAMLEQPPPPAAPRRSGPFPGRSGGPGSVRSDSLVGSPIGPIDTHAHDELAAPEIEIGGTGEL